MDILSQGCNFEKRLQTTDKCRSKDVIVSKKLLFWETNYPSLDLHLSVVWSLFSELHPWHEKSVVWLASFKGSAKGAIVGKKVVVLKDMIIHPWFCHGCFYQQFGLSL